MSYKRLIVLLITFVIGFGSSGFSQRPPRGGVLPPPPPPAEYQYPGQPQPEQGGGGAPPALPGGFGGGGGGGGGSGGGSIPGEAGENNPASVFMTQGEFALSLVKKMNPDKLPVNVSEAQAIAFLAAQGYQPVGGWTPGANVTIGTIAVVIAQIMGLDFDDEESAIDECKLLGIDFATIGSALNSMSTGNNNSPGQPQGSDLLRLPPNNSSGALWTWIDNTTKFKPPALTFN